MDFADDSSHSSNNSSRDEVIEMFSINNCLFCNQKFSDPYKILSHCAEDHNFSLIKCLNIQSFEDIEDLKHIKLINYIRAHPGIQPSEINKNECLDNKYLKPVHQDDSLLMIDIDLLVQPYQNGDTNKTKKLKVEYNANNKKEEIVSFKNKITTLEKRLKDMSIVTNELREKLKQILESKNGDESINLNNTATANDAFYFDSYAYIEIHEEMLKDKVRTESYQKAIYSIKTSDPTTKIFEGKIVLDVGCGTGILSLFAAKAGAKKVYAVDQSNIIYEAMDIAKQNNLDDKIQFLKGKIEEITLPVDKVDIIVSEWMGYFLLSESMMSSVIYARDKYLDIENGGLMLPSKLNLYLQPACDPKGWFSKYKYWSDVYGFKMSAIRRIKTREIDLSDLTASLERSKHPTATDQTSCDEMDFKLLTPPAIIKTFDMYKVTESDYQSVSFAFSFKPDIQMTLNGTKDATIESSESLNNLKTALTSFVMFFDAQFYPDNYDITEQVYFSTGPTHPSTHWKQTVLHLPEKIKVNGQEIKGVLEMSQITDNNRTWCITIDLGLDRRYVYDIS